MREKGEEPVMFRYAFNVNDLFLLFFQILHASYFMMFFGHMIDWHLCRIVQLGDASVLVELS